jgi:hypothetical protein
MDLQEIEVVIEKNGQVRVEVRGVKGTSCLDLTHEVEQALGGAVLDRQMTPEALEEARTEEAQQQHLGGAGG